MFPIMYSLMERHGSSASSAARVGVRSQAKSLFERGRSCLTEQFVHAGVPRDEAEKFINNSYGCLGDPNPVARPPVSPFKVIRHFLQGIAEKAAGWWSTESNRHRRLIRASDTAGCQPVWDAAVQLMREYPQGIPADHAPLKRCA